MSRSRFGAPLTLLVAAVLTMLTGCGLGGPDAPSAEVGDCLDMASVSSDEVSDIATVDCQEEHDGQVVHTFEMPDGEYPTDAEWSEAIEQECLDGFEDFVGTTYAESELVVQDLSPTRESWEAGDRQVLCLAFLNDGTTSTSFDDAEI